MLAAGSTTHSKQAMLGYYLGCALFALTAELAWEKRSGCKTRDVWSNAELLGWWNGTWRPGRKMRLCSLTRGKHWREVRPGEVDTIQTW